MQNSMPMQNDGLIATLNRQGFMTTSLDEYSRQYIAYAQKPNTQVLEIGAAYGIASLEALKVGAKVIANDLDRRHLNILKSQCSQSMKNNLTLAPGRFPDLHNIAAGSISAVLACRVFHLFNGKQIEESIKKTYDLLQPKGKFFLVVDSPYQGVWSKFLPVFKNNKEKGVFWPGYVNSSSKYCDYHLHLHIPEQVNLLDSSTMLSCLIRNGFEVEKASYINRQGIYPAEVLLDGRESFGIIARKN